MDIKQFADLLRSKRKEVDTLMRRAMPIRVGNLAKRHYQENFRQGGFVNDGLKPWPKTKRQTGGGKSAASQHGPLLSTRNHLFSEVRYETGDYRVRVFNPVPYAPVHNWGATLTPTVTPKMRRFAWAMYYQASGKSKAAGKGRKSAKKEQPGGSVDPEAAMWRGLALTKKKRLSIKIPQRQFIGQSRELDDALRVDIERQLEQILKS
ncbi:hypothetical protein [Alistipes sp.]|uniref:hypothetical protein n=1 Tax=Alistipes sp. TaxID=1872444 RepID=UPI003AF06625